MVTNNSVNISSQGVIYYNGTGTMSGLDGSTAGFVLTSNGTGVAPSFQANAGSTAIQTINGDSGSISGTTVTIYANQAADNCGHTVLFDNSGATSTLKVTDALNNTTIASGSGASITTGNNNTVLGYNSFNNAAANADTGNTVVGSQSAQSINGGGANNVVVGYLAWSNAINPATGLHNIIIGSGAGDVLESGSFNLCIGGGSGSSITTGDANVCFNSAGGITTGSFNTVINSNTNYTGAESNNILLFSQGVLGESDVIRIRDTTCALGAASACYIGGIQGVSVSNKQYVTIDTSTGQLGSDAFPLVTWTDVTGATQTLVVNQGFITNRGGGVTYTLPASAALGDFIKIIGKSGIAVITPNANQQILIGSTSGTVGVTGTATANDAGDCITLICITSGASTVWRAESVIGTWTLA